ncbi:MAG: hypothetical protein DRR42_14225 [Gammaproteobacteria bacterium]|nr:MAG: hypothetical protein DRR42_14225 [Gammaproteobacteria bacterium]
METWSVDSLALWGKENGYRVRKLESGKGAMFHLPTSTKAIFTIYLSPNDGSNAVEVAFNTGAFPEAQSLLENLKGWFEEAPVNGAHKWPRIGSKTCDKKILSVLSGV